MGKGDDERVKGQRLAWRRPRIEGLGVAGTPTPCNPAFPQAAVCAGNGVLQATVRCNQKGIFS